VEQARSTWTDQRLDDLARSVENGFNRIDEGLRSMSGRIDALGGGIYGRIDALSSGIDGRIDALSSGVDGRIDALGARLDTRIVAIDRRLDALQRTMLQLGGGMLLAILATLVSVLATRA
jgi:hypothetical protein